MKCIRHNVRRGPVGLHKLNCLWLRRASECRANQRHFGQRRPRSSSPNLPFDVSLNQSPRSGLAIGKIISDGLAFT